MAQQLSPRDRQRLMREEEERSVRDQERSIAASATQRAMDSGEYAAPGYWDVIGDPDIEREELDDEHLGEYVKTEMSDKFALGNITYDDWKSWGWRIENEFFTMRNEFRDADCKLDSVEMAMMYGEQRPVLTNERARRLRSAQSVKKAMTSLSVGARGLRSGTEIHAVAKTESPMPEEENGGWLDRAKRKLAR